MENKLLSVIIPVYNGENYIDTCLNSVTNQSYQNLDIIIINDGSKDNSLDILNKWASKDCRIRVIDQDNQGSSKTRENGIELALGEYLTFVDIDDYLELNTYEIAMNKLNDNDILCFGISCDFEQENYQIIRRVEANDNLVEQMFKHEIFNFVWNKIYRTSLVKHKNYFPRDFNQGEDLVFNCLTYHDAKKIVVIDDVLYHYIYRQKDTMISTFTKDNDMVLNYKRKYVSMILNNSQSYYDYMLKEYEVFTINLFMKNNHLSYKDKVKMIKDNILRDDIIKKGIPNNSYGKVFKMIANTYNAHIIVITYGILSFLKNCLGSVYLKIRKVIYKK